MSEPIEKPSWTARVAAAAGGLLVLVFIGGALFGDGGVARHDKLRAELADLEARNARLRSENRLLEARIEALRHDPGYIEAVIKDELGWVAKDEMVLIFPEGDTAR